MINTCQTVKRADRRRSSIGRKVYVDSRRMKGFVPHKCFNGKQIHTILIEMGSESMAEGMTGNSALPSEPVLMGMDMS